MSLASVEAYFAANASDVEVLQFGASLATVQQAAAALGVAPSQIAKTLTLMAGGETIVLVLRGDARLDNRKFRERFGAKPRMLDPAEVERVTGHPVGGVGPFGLIQELPIYCDLSLRSFDEVFPSGGTPNTAIRLSPDRLAALTGAEWVDVAQPTDTEQDAASA